MSKNRLIFAHIPKTAGTSVRLHLKEYLTENLDGYTEIGVYHMKGWPNPIPGGCAPDKFHAHSFQDNWDFLYGHVTLQQILSNPNIDRRDKNITVLSFVRHPVERLLSEYNYIASTPSHPRYELCITTPPMDFFDGMWKNEPNIHFRYLNCAHDVKWDFIVATNKHVSEACKLAYENLTGAKIDAQRFAIRRNVTKDFKVIGQARKLSVSDIPSDKLAKINDLHSQDLRLFEAVNTEGIIFRNPAWSV